MLHSDIKYQFFDIDLWYYQSEKESSRTEQLRGQHSVCVLFGRMAQTHFFAIDRVFLFIVLNILLFLTEFFPFTVLII